MRVLFALAMTMLAYREQVPFAVALFSAGYLVFAGAVMTWKLLQRPPGTLTALLVDTSAYLVSVTFLAQGNLWIILHQFCFLALTILLLHRWQQLLMVFGTSIGYFLLVHPVAAKEAIPGLVVMSLVAAFSFWQKQVLEERLFQASRQAVIYRAEAANVRVEERARIADDFHDGPLQMFMSLQVRLEVLRRMLEKDPAVAKQELEQLQEVWKKQVADARNFVRTIRAAATVEADLASATGRLVELFEKEYGVKASFHVGAPIGNVEDSLTTEVLQMVREALHNVRKHAHAKQAKVSLERGPEEIRLTIEDDGQGFPFSGSYTLEELDLLRLGPQSIKRRVAALQGGLILESKPGRGSTLRVRIPQ